MSGGRPLLRGLALLNDLAVIRALHGEAPVQRFVERLTPVQRAEYDAGFLPGRWYDEELQARLIAALVEQVDDAGVVRIGVAIVKYHVSRTQRFLARIAGPRRLMQRSSGLWSYWRDMGRLVVEGLDDTSARVAVLDHPVMASPGYALLYGAASAYAVYLSGVRSVRVRVDVEQPSRIVAQVHWAPHAESGAGFHSIDAAVATLPDVLG